MTLLPRTCSLDNHEVVETQHKYELTESEIAKIFVRPVYQDVIDSAAFRRLKKIHFLGSLDYVVHPKGQKPNNRHTRYQHSLGVARLALQFARERRLDEREETMAVVSALLHDIGHAPLSHSLESVFKKEFGVSHHTINERIVRGDAPIGIALKQILRKSAINELEVLATMNGKASSRLRELFNHSINIDTIEAIARSSTYLYENPLFKPPACVLTALLAPGDDSVDVLDTFWKLKDEVYNKLITNVTGLVADYVCQQYMRDRISAFNQEHYYLTDGELRQRHPCLFQALGRLSVATLLELFPDTRTIAFFRRRFIIKTSCPLETVFSVNSRYTQTKIKETYCLPS